MVATAQRFTELYPDVEISWEKRSLQEFADASIEDLAKRFDLLVIDHPWTGFGAQTKAILPLSDYLSKEYIKDQESNAVGKSYGSYVFHDKLWALPIDAATQVQAIRPDRLPEQRGADVAPAEQRFQGAPDFRHRHTEVRRAVREEMRQGCDQVKIMMSGGVASPARAGVRPPIRGVRSRQ